MFLLLPLWHQTEHFPLKTVSLVLVNVLAFAALWPREQRQGGVVAAEDLQAAARELTGVMLQNNSGLDPATRDIVSAEKDRAPFPSQRLMEVIDQVQAKPSLLTLSARYRWDLAYPVFEALKRSWTASPGRATPYRRYGFNAQRPWSLSLLTHQFLHAGFLHLFFNMLFLWVLGCVLEQHEGWRLAGIYAAGGAAAALAQAYWRPPGDQVMVGASGAVSALMGFSLIGFPRTKIKLGYIMILALSPRLGAFDAPLWFFLPLWLFEQVLMTLMTVKAQAVNVGYVAHVGGFLFGIAAAFALGRHRRTQADSTPASPLLAD